MRLIILLLVDEIVQFAHQNLAESTVSVLVLLRLNAVLVRVVFELLLTDFEQSADLVDGVILLHPAIIQILHKNHPFTYKI